MSSSTSSSYSYSDDSDSFESYYSDMSATSTPNKRRSAGVANQTLENVTPHMQDDVQGMLCPDAPIEAFVQHVWGVHPDEISAIFGNSWTLPPEHLDKYKVTASSGDSIAEDVVGSKLIFPPMGGLSDSIEFVIRRIIFEHRGLIGSGTMVYEVLRLGRTEAEALKINRPLTIRDLEATIIRTLRERIPGWKDHLPEISFSTTLTAEELGLPRVQLLKQVPPTDFRLEDRHMHAMAGELYNKLWEVDSVTEFEQVFLDCVECHYHAFNEGKVLHRDLSENNLIFKRKEGEVKGILNDWDMASFLDVTNKVRNTTAKHRTGTIPFMACDLLVDDPPAHLYRHDLESFFYILVWAAILYDFKNKAILKVPNPLANWDAGEMSRVRQAKGSFITYKLETDLIMNLIQPAFHGIRDKWILPLRMLFKNALRSIDDEADQNPSYDTETCGGHITFLTFMKALNGEPRTLA